jgi:hypothetical protein
MKKNTKKNSNKTFTKNIKGSAPRFAGERQSTTIGFIPKAIANLRRYAKTNGVSMAEVVNNWALTL